MLLTPSTMTLTKSKHKKFPNKHKSLALFHINACSLNKNFNDLEHLPLLNLHPEARSSASHLSYKPRPYLNFINLTS